MGDTCGDNRFELFGISEQLDCSDCMNHGGDWDCDHVHCRKGTDTISRAAAIDVIEAGRLTKLIDAETAINGLKALPSVQPFHNITMNDVLKYIDGMPEDVWQEFVGCLECRGWEMQRRTAKWCGSEFA